VFHGGSIREGFEQEVKDSVDRALGRVKQVLFQQTKLMVRSIGCSARVTHVGAQTEQAEGERQKHK
jgi:hypothetical protein